MSENINITINDQPVSVPKGTLVVEAASRLELRFLYFVTTKNWGRLDAAVCVLSKWKKCLS